MYMPGPRITYGLADVQHADPVINNMGIVSMDDLEEMMDTRPRPTTVTLLLPNGTVIELRSG